MVIPTQFGNLESVEFRGIVDQYFCPQGFIHHPCQHPIEWIRGIWHAAFECHVRPVASAVLNSCGRAILLSSLERHPRMKHASHFHR